MKLTSRILNVARVILCGLLVGLCGITAARAATYTWTGTGFMGQNYLWSDDFNWAGNKGPTPGEAEVTIVFPNNNAPKNTTNDLIGLSVASIQFQGSNYVIQGKPAGNALKLYSGGLAGWTLTATYDGNYFGATCPLVLSNYGVVAVSVGSTFSVLSPISGPGGITKVSPGALKYAAAANNTYAGTTTVSDGKLILDNGVFSPSLVTFVSVPGKLVIGGTNQSYSPLVQLYLDNQIANTATVIVNENAELWFDGHDDTIGSLTILDGANVYTGLGQSMDSAGLLTLNGNITNTSSTKPTTAFFNGRLDLGNATRTFNINSSIAFLGAIAGSGGSSPGIIKSGEGVMFCYDGTNTYSGSTIIQEGKLELTGSTSLLGTTGAGTVVSNGATLNLVNAQIGNEPLTIFGDSFNDSVFVRGTSVWSGPITLNGDCRFSDAPDGPSPIPDLTLSGAIGGTGSLRKVGDGWLHFTGFANNTYTGGFFCEHGTAWFSKSASAAALFGPLTVSRAGASFPGAVVEETQINQIPNSVPVTVLDSGFLNVESGVTETIGALTIAGGTVFADGTLTLNGDVTNHISVGGINLINGDIVLPSTRIVHCDANAALLGGGNWSGAGGITKTGPGTLQLFDPHTYSGTTTVKEGTLRLSDTGRPGSTAAGTVVEANGQLYLDGVNVSGESLVLNGGGSDGAAITYHNTNTWSGPVEIHNGAEIKAVPVAKLSLLGAIFGDGGLNHFGNGILVLGGMLDNTYSGTTFLAEGTMLLSKSGSYYAIPHSLVAGYGTNGAPATMVKCTTSNQFGPLSNPELLLGGVTLFPGAILDCGGFNQSIANLFLTDASATTGGGTLSLSGNLDAQRGTSGSSSVSGTIQLITGLSSTHTFNVASNVNMFYNANTIESGTQNIFKDGAGLFGNLGALNFNGTLTIHKGRWLAANATPFGSITGPTIVHSGASLVTYVGTFNEPLQLAGSGDGGIGALDSAQTNSFTGPITLTADTVINAESTAILTLVGAINGPGALTKEGQGILQLTGNASTANTFAGGTFVSHGKLELGKNAIAIPGALTTLGNSGNNGVRLLLPAQIADNSSVALTGSDYFDLNGNAETIGALSGNGSVLLDAATLTTGGNDATTGFSGSISGTGGLTKMGKGSFSLYATNTYTGTTTVNDGTLLVFGQQSGSQVTVNNGGKLGGTGRVGNVMAFNGGVISPGTSVGQLNASTINFIGNTAALLIEINGTTPGTGYDQLKANGSVSFMGGALQLAMNTVGAISNQYVIIDNDLSDLVGGTFTGLAEGAMITNNGTVFAITYHGGDGNDVALIQQSIGPSTITGVQRDGSGITLNGIGAPGVTYNIEATTNLTPPVVWTVIGSANANGAGLIQYTDANAAQFSMRFYRFRYP